MATAIKKCRVCGKPYEACHTMRHNTDVFRWQEVACSPECGSIYLAQIEESRKSHTSEVDKAEHNTALPEDIHISETEDIDIDEESTRELKELDEYFDDMDDTE